MAIRKLLLPLQTATTAEAAFSTAAIVSRLWCAHLAVLHVTTDRKQASAVREAFESLAAKHGLTVTEATPNADEPTASFAEVVGREPEVVAYQARLADLIVVPHPASTDEVSSSDALHAVLFELGTARADRAPDRACFNWKENLPWLERLGRICIGRVGCVAVATSRASHTHPLVRSVSTSWPSSTRAPDLSRRA